MLNLGLPRIRLPDDWSGEVGGELSTACNACLTVPDSKAIIWLPDNEVLLDQQMHCIEMMVHVACTEICEDSISSTVVGWQHTLSQHAAYA